MNLLLVKSDNLGTYILSNIDKIMKVYPVPDELIHYLSKVMPFVMVDEGTHNDLPVEHLDPELLDYIVEASVVSGQTDLNSRLIAYALLNKKPYRVPLKELKVFTNHPSLCYYLTSDFDKFDRNYDFIQDFVCQARQAISTFDTTSKYTEYKGGKLDLTTLGEPDLDLLNLLMIFIYSNYRDELYKYELAYIYSASYVLASYPVDSLATHYRSATEFIRKFYHA